MKETCYNLALSPDGDWLYFLHQAKSLEELPVTLQRINVKTKKREIVLKAETLLTP